MSDFQNCHCKKLQSVGKLTIADDRSTVGCGPCGRPKWHAIPTQSDNCPTHRSLRAATRAAPYGRTGAAPYDWTIHRPMIGLKKYKQKLKVLNRKQSRRIEKCKENKTKLGKNFYKTQKQINKIKEKNSNKKLYNLHQIVNEIINLIKENKCNHLIMENLNVKQMTSKKNVIKKIGKKKSKSMKKNMPKTREKRSSMSISPFYQICTFPWPFLPRFAQRES